MLEPRIFFLLQRKVRPGRGRAPTSPIGSPASLRGGRSYSLNDDAVHYGGGSGGGSRGGHGHNTHHRNGFTPREGPASPGSAEARGFARRSGGSDSAGFARRSGGSDPGSGGCRGSGHQHSAEGGDAGHFAALEEKVQRRLRQNREAAQRSRQRKKAYMAALEAEVWYARL